MNQRSIRFFLVTSSGRVGSKWIGSILRQNKNIIYENELMKVGYKCRGSATSVPTFKGVTAAFEWLESSDYKKEFPDNSSNAVGFKPVGPGCSFQSWLKDCGTGEVGDFRIIYLYRRNSVDVALSEIRLAQKSGNSEKLSKLSQIGVTVDTAGRVNASSPDQLATYIENINLQINRRFNQMMDLQFPILPVCYESLLQSEEKIVSRMFSFLGVHQIEYMQSNVAKRNPVTSYRESFVNWENLKTRIEKSKLLARFVLDQ